MAPEENAVINHETDGNKSDIWQKSSKMRQRGKDIFADNGGGK